jgi:DNA polymerase/3'-5' exonuclease PolX
MKEAFTPEHVMSRQSATGADAAGNPGELLTLPGMDAERVSALVTQLRVRSRAELRRALFAGRVVGLRGFTRELRSRLQAALEGEREGP